MLDTEINLALQQVKIVWYSFRGMNQVVKLWTLTWCGNIMFHFIDFETLYFFLFSILSYLKLRIQGLLKRLFLQVFLFLLTVCKYFFLFLFCPIRSQQSLLFGTLAWTLCIIKDSFVPLGQVEQSKKFLALLTRLCWNDTVTFNH